jgi:hypothetical protein
MVEMPCHIVTGAHAFQPPNFAQGDQRGPCPGLNALANHGYIPRNGIVGVSPSGNACAIMLMSLTRD